MIGPHANPARDARGLLDSVYHPARLPGRGWVLPPSSVATPCLNANVSWPACVGERH